MTTLEAASQKITHWRERPEAFVFDNFKVEPDAFQLDILRAFPDPKKQQIAMKACVGPGKTAVLSWCGWNFLTCYANRGEHPKGAAVAVTLDNLQANLWPEFAKWQSRSEFLLRAFTHNSERIYANDFPKDWFLEARGWPKTATPEQMGKTLSGLHSQFPIVLMDESGGIPTPVLRAAQQVLSRCVFGKVVQAGNPIIREGALGEACLVHPEQWFIVTITGDPDDPKAWVNSPRILNDPTIGTQPREWNQRQIDTYGRNNPWVMAQVLGMFPPTSLNALLSDDDVREAMARSLPADAYNWTQPRIGVDVARFGDDRTCLFPRQGKRAFEPVIMRHARDSAVSTDIATRILAEKTKFSDCTIVMDATGGWAAGARDVLKASGYDPVSVQFHKPGLDQRYKNRRAEMWFTMSEAIKAGAWLPNVPELIPELTIPTYTFVGGQFQIEAKDQVKERLGRSPDLADALALTFGVADLKVVKQRPQWMPQPTTFSG